MKRIIGIILALFLALINMSVYSAQSFVSKDIKAVTNDGFNIEAVLSYPKIKSKKRVFNGDTTTFSRL